MRSWLFVPADRPERFSKAIATGADAIIVDLEDSVAAEAKDAARRIVAEELAGLDRAGAALYVRLNPFATGRLEEDAAAAIRARPDGVVLPKAETGADVARLDQLLRVLEAEEGLADGVTRILAIATETPRAVFGLGSYEDASPRLSALAWGAEDLSAVLGVEGWRDAAGTPFPPYRLVRNLALFGAHAASVDPIDTVYTNVRDLDGLRAEAEASARDGFAGKLAIHPAQVSVINEAFTPKPAAVDRARRIIAALDASGRGAALFEGEMIDLPHRIRANAVLARAKRAGIL
ncbi:MAG: CoA ester lyase [Hyphomicrobiaceae bacterium]|nr:CoA ester lyase [Hyphomicrobiaceae bacterium]